MSNDPLPNEHVHLCKATKPAHLWKHSDSDCRRNEYETHVTCDSHLPTPNPSNTPTNTDEIGDSIVEVQKLLAKKEAIDDASPLRKLEHSRVNKELGLWTWNHLPDVLSSLTSAQAEIDWLNNQLTLAKASVQNFKYGSCPNCGGKIGELGRCDECDETDKHHHAEIDRLKGENERLQHLAYFSDDEILIQEGLKAWQESNDDWIAIRDGLPSISGIGDTRGEAIIQLAAAATLCILASGDDLASTRNRLAEAQEKARVFAISVVSAKGFDTTQTGWHSFNPSGAAKQALEHLVSVGLIEHRSGGEWRWRTPIGQEEMEKEG